jgi:hypothetical protein
VSGGCNSPGNFLRRNPAVIATVGQTGTYQKCLRLRAQAASYLYSMHRTGFTCLFMCVSVKVFLLIFMPDGLSRQVFGAYVSICISLPMMYFLKEV